MFANFNETTVYWGLVQKNDHVYAVIKVGAGRDIYFTIKLLDLTKQKIFVLNRRN